MKKEVRAEAREMERRSIKRIPKEARERKEEWRSIATDAGRDQRCYGAFGRNSYAKARHGHLRRHNNVYGCGFRGFEPTWRSQGPAGG